MCGIFGVINFDGKPVDKEKVLSARDVLAHRGPDDNGIYYSNCHPESFNKFRTSSVEGQSSVALAHRRLSIIDLSPAAHQPMVSDDGRYVIVFNGEIFNYREIINSQLKIKNLRTNSDTEVILKLYELEGPECLNRLRGMFAFAIWDDKEKKLFAARDRFGIKPFYYLHNHKEFIFSSELKAIKHYKNGLTLSMKGMDAFLRTGSVPAPLTIYEETKALLPGHWLTINSDQLTIKNYWSYFDLLNTSHTSTGLSMTATESLRGAQRRSNLRYDDATKNSIRNSLLDTIKAHMVSDVEVGAFLSGGIDSTAIVSLMRQVGQEKIKTISVTFPGHPLDESKYSNTAAKKYQTDHFEYRLQEDELLNDFEKIIEAMDQPTIDGINTYFVSKAAASFGLKVVLSGVGGDELFGGYASFVNIPKYHRIKSLPLAKPLMKAAGFLLNGKLPAKAIEYFKNPNSPNSEYKLIRGLFTDTELQALGWRSDSRRTSFAGMTDSRQPAYRTGRAGMTEGGVPSFRPSSESDGSSSFWQSPESEIQHPISGNQNLSPLQYISMMESFVYMRNQLLRDSDVFSMMHSLELRVPFVDHMLYSAVLPYLDAGFDKNFPKKMLVDAVGDLPDEIVHRPKQGFTFPFADWMKRGKIKDAINDLTNIGNPLFNQTVMTDLLNNFEADKIHWSRIWALFIAGKFS
ncbi:MAG: asparagine synthase (glutamine-hydrolyzing) [bacterium]|nr:asparagine synthase (glutamine-hydrolyzing) [bacterium]